MRVVEQGVPHRAGTRRAGAPADDDQVGPGGQADSLHGQFVISDGHGGFTTELTQTGTVTALSDAAITARSDDGFTQTYLITADTRRGRAPLATGDIATIEAVAANGNNSATSITPSR